MKSESCILNELGYERFEAVIDMVGGKWKLRIVFFLAFHEVLRYGELKKLLHPITHKMLTAQLKELEKEGFIAARQGKGSVVLSRDNEMVKEQYLKRIEQSFETAIENAKYAQINSRELIHILEDLLKEE